MAQNPLHVFSVNHYHALRFLPSWIVFSITSLTSLSVPETFQILSWTLFTIFTFLLYFFLRAHKTHSANSLLPLSFTLLILMSAWPTTYSLKIPYQITDLFCYPYLLSVFWLRKKKNASALFILTLLGLFVRQNVLVVGLCALFDLYLENKKTLLLFSCVFFLALYTSVSSFFPGQSTLIYILQGLREPLLPKIIQIWKDTSPLTLFFPFLFLIPLTFKDINHLAQKHWPFLFAFGVICTFPFFAYSIVGKGNFERLVFPILWPFMLLVCIKIMKRECSFPFQILLFATSLLQGNAHHPDFAFHWPEYQSKPLPKFFSSIKKSVSFRRDMPISA